MGTACSRDMNGARRSVNCSSPEGETQGGGSACSAVGGLFFEPEGAVTTETWQYVGEGQGGYQKLQKYNYVGSGHGSYHNKEGGRQERGSKRGCVCALLMASLAAALCAASYLNPDAVLQGEEYLVLGAKELTAMVYSAATDQPTSTAAASTAPQTTAPMSTVSATPVPPVIAPVPVTAAPSAVAMPSQRAFVCSVGSAGDRLSAVVGSQWVAVDANSDGKATRDEILAQRATMSGHRLDALLAADTDQDGTLTRGEFASVFVGEQVDEKEVANEVMTWSDDKRAWCCENEGVGCTASTTHTSTMLLIQVATTQATLSFATTALPGSVQVAIPAAVTTVRPYNCKGSLHNWKAEWSTAKKAWCCAIEQLGCTETAKAASATGASPAPGPATGCDSVCEFESMEATCKERIEWSAKHAHQGDPNSCAAALADVIEHCPVCTVCPLQDSQCMEAKGLSIYDCAAGVSNWQQGWSPEKKIYCCKTSGVGCEDKSALGGPLFPCKSESLSSWSVDERAFCCVHKGLACPAAAKPAFSTTLSVKPQGAGKHYDCKAGYSAWQWGWSGDKKQWCCQHEQRGCQPGAGKRLLNPAQGGWAQPGALPQGPGLAPIPGLPQMATFAQRAPTGVASPQAGMMPMQPQTEVPQLRFPAAFPRATAAEPAHV